MKAKRSCHICNGTGLVYVEASGEEMASMCACVRFTACYECVNYSGGACMLTNELVTKNGYCKEFQSI